MNRIKQLRNERKLTIRELGAMLNMSHSNISEVENGRVGLTTENAIMFATFFGVSTDYLLGVSDYREPFIKEHKWDDRNDTLIELHSTVDTLSDEQALQILNLLKTFKGENNEK